MQSCFAGVPFLFVAQAAGFSQTAFSDVLEDPFAKTDTFFHFSTYIITKLIFIYK